MSDYLTLKEPNPITPKFRVWNNMSRRLWRVDKLLWDSKGRCQPVNGESFLMYSEKDILMQWTGLLDVNGCEIYEGDIVKFTGEGSVHKVVYDPPRFKAISHSLQGYECEVIGNIFENSNIWGEKIV